MPNQTATRSLYATMYVSRSLIAPAGDETQISKIVSDAIPFNQSRDVTGALIATHGYFAQHLEGSEPVIAALMGRIFEDSRHRDVRVIRVAPGVARLFGGWSMSYCGPTRFLDREIEPALTANDPEEHARRLLALMLEFARYDRMHGG